jgi:hypothetical protein
MKTFLKTACLVPQFVGSDTLHCFLKVTFLVVTFHDGSRDSSVGIATGYGLDDRGVGARVPVEARIFFSPRRPDRFWGPPDLLSGESFPGYKAGGA